MVLKLGTQAFQIHCFSVFNKEGAVRVTHTSCRWSTFDGQLEGIHLTRQGNFVPVQLWMAHIDRYQPIASLSRDESAARCGQDQL